MKTKVLFLLVTFMAFSLNAQTTHDLNWQIGSLPPASNLTIETGDTVRWTWTDAVPHTVQNGAGSTETFNSGVITGNGMTYSYTFTLEGTNPYFCGVHGAGNMSGTITVLPGLSVDEFSKNTFALMPNPATETLTIQFAQYQESGNIRVFDMVGKQLINHNAISFETIELNVTSLNKGMYLVRIDLGDSVQTKRVIIN